MDKDKGKDKNQDQDVIEEELEFHKKVYHFEETIRDSIKPVVQIKTVDAKTDIWGSKIGGVPYFPRDGMKYPADKEGNPMKLLSQLNLSEMPINPLLPNEGILQFYICNYSHDSYVEGLVNEDFAVIYHKDIIKDEALLISDFSFLDTEEDNFIVTDEFKIAYGKDTEPLSMYDYTFFEFAEFQPEHVAEELWKDKDTIKFRNYLSRGTKIGGYPHYIQELYPAYISECLGIDESNALLFQFDSNSVSDDEINYFIGNFFISMEDLRNLNFDNIRYTIEHFKYLD